MALTDETAPAAPPPAGAGATPTARPLRLAGRALGYRGLFAVSGVIALIGACAVLPVRTLR